MASIRHKSGPAAHGKRRRAMLFPLIITVLGLGLSGALPLSGAGQIEYHKLAYPENFRVNVPSGKAHRPPANDFEMQLALAQRGFSPGSIDGNVGSQTETALRMFQYQHGLPSTGLLDEATRNKLLVRTPILATFVVTAEAIENLRPVPATWLGKSQVSHMGHETALELVAEASRTHPDYIRLLNPTLQWPNVPAGTEVFVPNAISPMPKGKPALIRIFLGDRILHVYDMQTNLIAHFPCSIASKVAKRPLGRLKVVKAADNPNYTFNPRIFPESAEARRLDRKLIVPPGPNNPVGVAWISLSRPGYGIHGTPHPEKVGRTESHGCFRLANWNAEQLLKMVWVEMPVYVYP